MGNLKWMNFLKMSLLIAAMMVFVGCSDSSNSIEDRIQENSISDIIQTSSDDYNANTNGLITISTLKNWLDDWDGNKPASITGNLIILSVSSGDTSRENLGDSAAGIFSYDTSSDDISHDRSNGVIVVPSMVANGTKMDAFLEKFAIYPEADMVVVVMGKGSTGSNMTMGRVWYTLRYWGVPQEHLAILNGGLDYWTEGNGGLADSYFMAAATPPPDNGTASVKDLLNDNTILQVSLGELLDLVDGTVAPSGGFVVWDTRTPVEYDGSVSKGGLFEGHIKDAVNFTYSPLLDASTGYSYKDKSILANLLAAQEPGADTVDPEDGTTGLGYTADDAANGKIIIPHCKSSWRAAVALVATNVILGYPGRIYDGAWLEWGDLTDATDQNGNTALPADSPWLTDTAVRSGVVNYYNTDGTGTIPTITDPYAPSANAITDEDKGYKY